MGCEHICLGYKSNLRLYDRKFSLGVKVCHHSHLRFDLQLDITFLIHPLLLHCGLVVGPDHSPLGMHCLTTIICNIHQYSPVRPNFTLLNVATK